MHGTTIPLATRLRPTQLADVVGQEHLIGPNGPLRVLAENGHLPSCILWGPPGVGKTTLAQLLAQATGAATVHISGAEHGVASLRSILKSIKESGRERTRTVLFIDECHRWNKSQQDIFLPLVEQGELTLIGATTENPSYEVNAALLSRCRVFRLRRLTATAIGSLLGRAETELGKALPLDDEARVFICNVAGGDARHLLNIVEDIAALNLDGVVSVSRLREVLADVMPMFDKGGTMYNLLLSALHKSIRGSDAHASLYWLARLVQGGAPLPVIARRLVACALEDIGLADADAVRHAMVARDAVEFMGADGELALAHCVVCLATAPKSLAIANALQAAHVLAAETGTTMPKYPPTAQDDLYAFDYFPIGVGRCSVYEPQPIGSERELARRLEYWDKRRSRSPEAGDK